MSPRAARPQETDTVTFLGRGVLAVRVLSVVAFGLSCLLLAIRLLPASRAVGVGGLLLTVAVGQLLVYGAMGWLAWARPAMTRVAPDGIACRCGRLRLRQFPWSETIAVRPRPRGSLNYVLELAGGEAIELPGVRPEDGLWLAEIVERQGARLSGSATG